MSLRQHAVVACVAVVCAASRLLALARSPWDWDEALFLMGMRDYDVALHHPHPPGFPVYIAMGRLVRFVVGDDFRSLQAINLIAAMLVFPAVFFLARELRFCVSTALTAAVLFAFFPNVWFFGGGAFSDIPSIVIVLFAVALLLRGARDRNAYWLGTLLLALSIGIRPQNLLIGLFPGILATRKRRPSEIGVALLIGIVVVGAAYGGAIAATGSFADYVRIVREHGQYISRVDSWRNPDRTPLWRLLDHFFVKQYQWPLLGVTTSLFVIASIAGALRDRSRSVLWVALTFTPFAILSWLMLDRFSVSRFSIAYQPMFAILAADGIRRVGEWGGGRGAVARRTAIAATLLAAFIAYTLPALTTVRREIAPSILAARAVKEHLDPSRDRLLVVHAMSVFVDLEAPGFPYIEIPDGGGIPPAPGPRSWLLTDRANRGYLFRRDRGHLWNIARRKYFEVGLERLE